MKWTTFKGFGSENDHFRVPDRVPKGLRGSFFEEDGGLGFKMVIILGVRRDFRALFQGRVGFLSKMSLFQGSELKKSHYFRFFFIILRYFHDLLMSKRYPARNPLGRGYFSGVFFVDFSFFSSFFHLELVFFIKYSLFSCFFRFFHHFRDFRPRKKPPRSGVFWRIQ